MSRIFHIYNNRLFFDIKRAKICFLILFSLFVSKESIAQCTAIIGSNISPIEGCEILTIQFNDLSTGPVQSRTWNFGDGSPTTGTSNPIHSFSAGVIGDTTYIITLNTQCIGGSSSVAHDTVLVYKKPKVGLSANITTLCALTDSACFSNLSTFGPGYTCLWNFGDFTTSNQFEPCHIYSTGGIYSVQLTVTNTHGCANSITLNNYINVIPAPNLDFNISTFLGCAPLPVGFTNITDTVTTSFTSWQWNFGDGTPVVNAFNPPVHTYTSPGTYYITMSATNALGCSNSTTKAIVVRTTPTSGFSTISPVCVGSPSLLTYTGNGGSGAAFSWNFVGGIVSPGTGPGPHTTYWNTSGTMNVSLTVTDSGCTSSTTVPVLVNPRPTVSLSVSPNDTICQGQSAIFTAGPSSLVNYSFYQDSVLVQSSSANTFVSSSISSGDSFYVIGTNSMGCTSLISNVITIHVNPLPVVTLSSSTLSACSGDNITFTASPAGYNTYTFYQGFLLLQSTANNVYSTNSWVNGNSISVTATSNGCTGPASNIITPVISQPLPAPQVNCGTSTDTTIQFTWLPVTGATGYLVSVNGVPFSSPSSGTLGTTQLVTGLTPGSSSNILVIALGSGPCGNSDTSALQTCFAMNCGGINFTMNPYQTICRGDNVTLSLSGFSMPGLNVSWNGGPAGPYSNYTISPTTDTIIPVVVSNPLQPACVPVTNYFVIHVNPLPVVTLSSSTLSACSGDNITFTASPAGYNTYTFYQGFLPLQSTANNVYSTNSWVNGNSISVTATSNGCTGPASNIITPAISQPLPAPQVNCGTSTDTTIQFTWLPVTGATGYLVSVNGAPFTSPSSGTLGTTQLVTGLTPGSSSNILVIALGSGPCGNSDTSALQTCFAMNCGGINFTMNPYQTICRGDNVTLSLSGFSMPGLNVSWNGGPAGPYSSYTISPTTDTIIPVVVSNPLQPACVPVTNYFIIHVNPLPVVTLSSSTLSACSGDNITFTASPAGYNTYTFYQGFLPLQSTANNVYSTNSWVNGNSISVTATSNGCTGPASNIITPVISQPLPAPQVNCGTSTDTTIQFTWLPVTGAAGYLVSVNGAPFASPSSGTLGTTQLVTGLTPGSSSNILVIALGSGPCGNSDTSALQTCFAMNCGGINFTMNPYQTICRGDNVTLSLSGFSMPGLNVSWNGGPAGPYSSYTISPTTDTIIPVVVSNPLQPTCVPVTNYFVIHVNPSPVATLSLSPISGTICQGVPATFSVSPAGYSNYSFYNGGTLLQSSNNPDYIPASLPGNLLISATTTYLGCTYTTNSLPLNILPAPAVTLSTSVASGALCYGDTVTFTASPAGYPNYTFYNGTTVLQNTSSNILTGFSFSGIGNSISVVAGNTSGCNSASSNTFSYNVLPPVLPTLSCSDADHLICEGDPVTFTAFPSGMSSYDFFDGTTLLQSSAGNSYTGSALQPGNSISVSGTDAAGCRTLSSNALVISIKPRPTTFISASDTTICSGTSVTLNAEQNPVMMGTTFSWNTGSVDTIVSYSPAANTSYILNSSLNGCAGIPDTLLILVDNNPPPFVNAGGSTTICLGDSATLSGTGGSNIFWTPSTGLSNSTISNPHASPAVTTTYILNTSNLYCVSQASVTITIDLCLTDITGPIPTCITPNEDGTNDYFIIPNVGYFEKNSIVIYNRWGNVIYTESPYTNNWDGKSANGTDLPDALYYYVLDLGNEKKPHTGYVLIHR